VRVENREEGIRARSYFFFFIARYAESVEKANVTKIRNDATFDHAKLS